MSEKSTRYEYSGALKPEDNYRRPNVICDYQAAGLSKAICSIGLPALHWEIPRDLWRVSRI